MLLGASAPPAGGTATGEVLVAAAAGLVAIAAVVAIGVAHRRNGLLRPIAELTERRTGLPAWSTLPVGIAGASLVSAVWGYYWDVSWHIDRGRDPGAFANPAHWFILIGLDGIAFAGVLAFFLGDERSPCSVRLTDRWHVPSGAFLLGACGVVAMLGFPLDDVWHRLFGQDVTAWGPTHIQMIGGASLSTLACWALTAEGRRAAGDALTSDGRRWLRLTEWSLAGAFLIGLSTLQVEFDFGVPQFRQIEQPVLIAIAASVALVAARIRLGRGGALFAVAFFAVVRGALALGVAGLGRDTMHFPLYVVEAVIVEAVVLWLGRDRQLSAGMLSGFLIGTVGFASEFAWSHAWMPLPWPASNAFDMLLFAALAGTAGGILGGFVGRALTSDVAHEPAPRWLAPAGWLGVVMTIGLALPMTAHPSWTADLQVMPAAAGRADVVVRLSDDAKRAVHDAAWFHVLSWQGSHNGSDGGLVLTDLVAQPDGTYRTAHPVPVSGTFKTILRLHSGASLQAVPIYLPDDAAIPAPAVPAVDSLRPFVADKHILQREAKTDSVMLERAAYAVLGLLAAAWMVVLAWGLARLEVVTGGARGTVRPWPRSYRTKSARSSRGRSSVTQHAT